MPVFNNVLAGAAGSGGASEFLIERSLRFSDTDTASLTKTFASAGDRKRFTISLWVKRGKLGKSYQPFFCNTNSSGTEGLYFDFSNDYLHFGEYATNGWRWQLQSQALYRDTNAWYSIIASVDTTQATESDRVKLYVNGEQITTLYPGFNTYPSQNLDIQFNNTSLHGIGRMGANTSSTYHFDGLMAEFHFVDGAAKAATDFGGIHADTGVWSPIEYTGSHNVGSGVNGFYLDFSDNSSNAALGYDAAGSNNWTVNNIIGPSGVDPTVPPSGSSGYSNAWIGFYLNNNSASGQPLLLLRDPSGTDGTDVSTAGYQHGGTTGQIWSLDDVLQWAIDWDNRKVWIGRNNTWYAGDVAGQTTNPNPSTGTDPAAENFDTSFTYFLGNGYDSANFELQVPSTATYTPPTGFSYWGGASLSSWKISGTNQGAVGDVYQTAIPKTGKTYIEAIVKGGFGLNATLGLMNFGETARDSDSFFDSPTNYDDETNIGGNFATWNRHLVGSQNIVSNGNLNLAHAASQGWTGNNQGSYYQMVVGNIGMTTGKWYWEITLGTMDNASIGLMGSANGHNYYPGYSANGTTESWGWGSNATNYNTSGLTVAGSPVAYAAGDTLGFAYDADNGYLYCHKNGTYLNSGNPAAGTGYQVSGYTGTQYFCAGKLGSTAQVNLTLNAGQTPFRHSPPTGYKVLCTQNFDDPEISKGSDYFDVKLYDGTANYPTTSTYAQNITGLGFSPDLVWIKNRTSSVNHNLFDTVRGIGASLCSNNTNAEYVDTSKSLTDFTSDGFEVTDEPASSTDTTGWGVNILNQNYVAWAWDAGNDANPTSISVGSLTNTIYNSSQTWSTYGTASGTQYGSYVWADVFDNLSDNPQNVGYCVYGPDYKWTFTNPVSVSSSVALAVWGIGTVTLNEGESDAVTLTSAGNTYNTISTTSLAGATLKNIKLDTGTAVYIFSVTIDGARLVDPNIAPAAPSIASTVRANTTAGFSIMTATYPTYSGTSSIAHGLNTAPHMWVMKDRDSADGWYFGHKDIGADQYMRLESTAAKALTTTLWDNKLPDSNFIYNNGTSMSNVGSYLLLAWAPVEGYSKFGVYTGNGSSSDGTFVWTGFRPRFVCLKNTSSSQSTGGFWVMIDTERDQSNNCDNYLAADSNAAEGVTTVMDVLSNGFKLTNPYTSTNGAGIEYVYFAFAESPFKYARAA